MDNIAHTEYSVELRKDGDFREQVDVVSSYDKAVKICEENPISPEDEQMGFCYEIFAIDYDSQGNEIAYYQIL